LLFNEVCIFRKPGRPPKLKNALFFQPNSNYLDDSSDDSDNVSISKEEASESTNPEIQPHNDDDTDNDTDFPDIFADTRALTKNNNPNNIPPLVFEGEAPKAVPRGRGRPRGSKNKPKSSL